MCPAPSKWHHHRVRETVFLFDYASPYSYLANEVLPAQLADVRVVLRPVYLRGFESFSKGVPYTAHKLAYMIKDLLPWRSFLTVSDVVYRGAFRDVGCVTVCGKWLAASCPRSITNCPSASDSSGIESSHSSGDP